MPSPTPIMGLLRDIVALTVASREIRRVELEEFTGQGRTTIARGLKEAVDGGYLETQGATKTLRYVPTERAKKARAATSDDEGTAEVLPIAHYGARLIENFRVNRVVAVARARGGRTIDSTVHTRKATPEELARCFPTTAAESAAAPSGTETPETPSAASTSTPSPGDASVPEPASPSGPSPSTSPDPEAFFEDCTARCDWADGQAVHDRDCPHSPLHEAALAAGLQRAHEDGGHDDHAVADCPSCDVEPLQRGPDPLPPISHPQCRPMPTPVLGVLGTIAETGEFTGAPSVALLEREELEAWRAEEPSAQPDAIDLADPGRATLDDVTLAREQIRARYTLKLLDILTADAPEHIFDRIESLTA